LLKKIARKLKRDLGKSKTKDLYLKDSAIKDMEGFIAQLKNDFPSFNSNTLEYIGRNYGEKSGEILNLALQNPSLAQVLTPDGEKLAEVSYVIENEMVYHLSDVFFRRTGIGTLGYPGEPAFESVALLCKEYFQWSEQEYQDEIAMVMHQFEIPKSI